MSTYDVHDLCRHVLHDQAFRQLILKDPEAAVAKFAFSDGERRALIAGDVAWLHENGASGFLLLILSRFEIFGLTLDIYNKRMRSLKKAPAQQNGRNGK